jgi:hypothetical protein
MIWVPLDSVMALRLRELSPNLAADSLGHRSYFVRWHGVLKGPGIYGHMGIAGYQFEVDTMYSAVPQNAGSCQP